MTVDPDIFAATYEPRVVTVFIGWAAGLLTIAVLGGLVHAVHNWGFGDCCPHEVGGSE